MSETDRRLRAAEAAAEWWVILQGEVGRKQREQYVDWLRESSLHVAEMLRVAEVHNALDQFRHWPKISSDEPGDDEGVVELRPGRGTPAQDRPSRSRTRQFRLAWVAMPVLAMALTLGAWALVRQRGEVIQTERAERREISLADGSVVTVDPGTRLRVWYEPRARRVLLERGRALFQVAKNHDRPFLVTSGGATARAVGTVFAVENSADSIIVTVAEGTVALLPKSMKNPQGTGSPSRITTAGGQPAEIYLEANEQVIVRRGGMEPVHTVDSHRALAWADGRLVFDNQPLSETLRQFNQYNRIQLFVADPTLARRPISGVFNAADPESFVAFLQSVAPVNIVRSSPARITIEASK